MRPVYRARRERPLDIDVTSVVNEKDTRGYTKLRGGRDVRRLQGNLS